MRHTLVRHPDTPCAAVYAIEVEIARAADETVVLRYQVKGNPTRLVPREWLMPRQPRLWLAQHLPFLLPPRRGRRADELWQHTCFEAFLKPVGEESYVEFNFAATQDWQAYQLRGYRDGRHPIAAMTKPKMEILIQSQGFELLVTLPLAGIVPNTPWQVGLAAVIEETSGDVSYWALKHAPDKPDFHHADAFALTVTP